MTNWQNCRKLGVTRMVQVNRAEEMVGKVGSTSLTFVMAPRIQSN